MAIYGWCKGFSQELKGILPFANLFDVAQILTSKDRRTDLFIQLTDIICNKNRSAIHNDTLKVSRSTRDKDEQ